VMPTAGKHLTISAQSMLARERAGRQALTVEHTNPRASLGRAPAMR